MQNSLPRRSFLKLAAMASVIPLVPRTGIGAPAAKAPAAAEDTAGLTAYQLGPQIWVRLNNRPLTCYRAHRSQKYPYFFPLTGPVSGLSLTDETTLPYPHHRSLFFGCDRVNGGNYWQEGYETGQILSTGPRLAKEGKDTLVITDTCEWQKPGGPVIMKDERTLTITAAGEKVRMIDWAITWQAVADIRIQKTNHSLFSMRAALDITPKGGGNLVNAEGKTLEKGTAGVKSAWCDFYGARAGMPGAVEGIAIFDHPKNPWAPTPWFTRDYGFASPTPFNYLEQDWTLAAGKSVALRYAVILHAGDPSQANLPGLYQAWAR
jgi:hypothetical protein